MILAACPKCGGEPLLKLQPLAGVYAVRVICLSCGAHTRTIFRERLSRFPLHSEDCEINEDSMESCQNQAAEEWNAGRLARVVEDVQLDRNKLLNEFLDQFTRFMQTEASMQPRERVRTWLALKQEFARGGMITRKEVCDGSESNL
jgi:hypothetical protein